jgi:hypothetical protein
VRYDCAFLLTYKTLERSVPRWVEDYQEETLAEESDDWRSWFSPPLAPQPEGEWGCRGRHYAQLISCDEALANVGSILIQPS